MHRLIDIHAHFFTDEYLAAMRAAGIETVDGFPIPAWSEVSALARMSGAARAAALARAVDPCHVRSCATVSLRSLTQRCEMALADAGQHGRGLRVAGDLGAVLALSVQVHGLQRDLRLARCRHRLDDVDLALGERDPDWRGAQC